MIGEQGRERGLDGREKGLEGREKSSRIGERGVGRMMVQVEVKSSSSLTSWLAEPSKVRETEDMLESRVVE